MLNGGAALQRVNGRKRNPSLNILNQAQATAVIGDYRRKRGSLSDSAKKEKKKTKE